MKLKVCIVDDHAVVRSGVASLLQTFPELECLWEFENGQQLIDLIDQGHFPDIIILDSSMPVMSGIDTLHHLANHPILENIILLSYGINSEKIQVLKSLGVSQVISKSANADDIIKAVKFHIENNKNIEWQNHKKPNITNRELEFLKLICDEREFTYDQIAELMGVHNRTIDSFRKSLFQKLQIKSKSGLVLYAIKNGLNQ